MLEPHVLALESSRRHTLATYAARRERLLHARDDEKEQRRREALRRVAPGFDGNAGAALEPVRGGAGSDLAPSEDLNRRGRGGDVMDDLVDQLERMAAGTDVGGERTT